MFVKEYFIICICVTFKVLCLRVVNGQDCRFEYQPRAGVIQSPTYPLPYSHGQVCLLRLHLNTNDTSHSWILRLLISEFNLVGGQEGESGDYLRFHGSYYKGNGNPLYGEVDRLAMKVGEVLQYTSSDNFLDFLFHADVNSLGAKGFSINYDILKKDETANGYWSGWGVWFECQFNEPGNCTNLGTQTRYRSCFPPYGGGANCTGEPEDTRDDCEPEQCKPTTASVTEANPTSPSHGVQNMWSVTLLMLVLAILIFKPG